MNALCRLGTHPDYSLVVLSIDPAETPADAQSAQRDDIARFDIRRDSRLALPDRVRTGVQAVTDAVGFRSRFDPASKAVSAPGWPGVPDRAGTVSSYLLGLGYQPSDLGLGITRAANGVTARALPILLLCFHYDPTTGRYTLAIVTHPAARRRDHRSARRRNRHPGPAP